MNSLTLRLVVPLLILIFCFGERGSNDRSWSSYIALGGPSGAFAKNDFELVFENFTCAPVMSPDEDISYIVEGLKCSLGKNPKLSTLNMELSFAREIDEFALSVVILMPRKYGDFVLMNVTESEGCNLLANKQQVTLLRLGRTSLNRYSNFPNRCPFEAHKVYYLRGYRWDMDSLPDFRIESQVKIYFDYYVDGQRVIEGFIDSSLRLKTRVKF